MLQYNLFMYGHNPDLIDYRLRDGGMEGWGGQGDRNVPGRVSEVKDEFFHSWAKAEDTGWEIRAEEETRAELWGKEGWKDRGEM